MDAWMPYLSLPFFTSETGHVLFMFYALVLVGCHMQYVHSPVDISRRFTLLELVADLVGLTWMRNLCTELYPEVRSLQVFLFVHFVVHALSLAWGLLGWRSLDQHMREFRRGQGNRVFNGLEWIYEQSDTSLYFFLAVKVLTGFFPWLGMALVIATSAFFRWGGIKAWFAGPARAETPPDAAPAPDAAR